MYCVKLETINKHKIFLSYLFITNGSHNQLLFFLSLNHYHAKYFQLRLSYQTLHFSASYYVVTAHSQNLRP